MVVLVAVESVINKIRPKSAKIVVQLALDLLTVKAITSFHPHHVDSDVASVEESTPISVDLLHHRTKVNHVFPDVRTVPYFSSRPRTLTYNPHHKQQK